MIFKVTKTVIVGIALSFDTYFSSQAKNKKTQLIWIPLTNKRETLDICPLKPIEASSDFKITQPWKIGHLPAINQICYWLPKCHKLTLITTNIFFNCYIFPLRHFQMQKQNCHQSFIVNLLSIVLNEMCSWNTNALHGNEVKNDTDLDLTLTHWAVKR